MKGKQFIIRFFSILIAITMALTVLPKKGVQAVELNSLEANGIVIKADEVTIIEAEDWMAGGQDVAYHENTYEAADVYKHPNAQRPADPADSTKYVPQTKEGGSGGYILSYATDPEWLKYEVTVEVEGDYAVAFCCARGYEGGGLTLSVEGGASVAVPYTARTAADWSLGMTEGQYILHLTEGEHILKLDISWPWDIDYIQLTPVAVEEDDEAGIVHTIKGDVATKIEAEDWMAGGQDVAYHENTYEAADVYKHPNAQRPADPADPSKYVPQTKDSGSGGYHVSYATDPEWIKYKVNVETEGDYLVAINCSRGYDGGDLTLSVEGGASVSIPYTARTAADWSFGMTEGEYVLHLTAGEHILKLAINWPWDIDYIELTPVAPPKTLVGASYSIHLIEPWALRTYIQFSKNTEENLIPVAEFTNYGAYAILGNKFEGTTADDLMADPDAVKYTKADGNITVKDATTLTFDFYDGLFSYNLGENIYWVAYFETADGTHTTSVQVKSLTDIADELLGDADVSETEKAVLESMKTLKDTVTELRGENADLGHTYAPGVANPGTLGDRNTGYLFGTSFKMKLIEPWGVRVRVLMREKSLPVDGEGKALYADYEGADDYGLIFFHDKTGKYNGTMTPEQLKAEADAKVYSKLNGNAKINAGGVTAVYDQDIFTYNLDTELYCLPYIVIDGAYYYPSTVTCWNLLTEINEFAEDESLDPKETAVFDAMLAMYTNVQNHNG